MCVCTCAPCCAVDDWITIAWNGMQAKGIAAILYFIVWIIIGNFILLTLFLAILISTFSDEPEQTQASALPGVRARGRVELPDPAAWLHQGPRDMCVPSLLLRSHF